MNELDHSILISATPAAVWALVSDINQNPAWQSNCQSVVFISKQRNGKGTRWRYRNLSGKEHELEITAWYDGLGYEYRFLDGRARGRIRLQEIAEGTTVQWNFSYVPRGRLDSVRNALRLKRLYRKRMEDSLLALQAAVKLAVGDASHFEARSLMRDSLAYDARLHYRPRHPSRVSEEDSSSPPLPDEEPEVREDDTRPNPVFADATGDSPLSRQPVEPESMPESEAAEALTSPAPELARQEPSIWDVFGMERPEEDEAERAAQPAPQAEAAYGPPTPVVIQIAPDALQPGHPGLRKLLRRFPAESTPPGDGVNLDRVVPGG